MMSTCVYEDVNFELACVLFNIGAIHAAIAASETRSDPSVSLLLFRLKKKACIF